MPNSSSSRHPIIAIGGVGGSGTRLFSQMLREVGLFMGDNLNNASDNLTFTFLMRRANILTLSEEDFDKRWQAFLSYMVGHGHPPQGMNSAAAIESTIQPNPKEATWDKQVQLYLKGRKLPKGCKGDRWGWKEPNTHIVLPRLIPRMPRLKYIHVMRHGLDMAFSSNDKQVRRWGPTFLGPDHDFESCPPALKLRYWIEANRRLLPIAESMGDRFLWLKFEDVCHKPQATVEKLLDFIECDYDETTILRLASTVHPPESLDRYKQNDLSQFPGTDLAELATHGYIVP